MDLVLELDLELDSPCPFLLYLTYKELRPLCFGLGFDLLYLTYKELRHCLPF